jgi:hypothetical protein
MFKKILLLGFGATCFSSLSFFLSIKFFKFPFYVWEHVIVIVFLILYAKNFKFFFPKRDILLLFIAIFIWLFLLFVTDRGSLRDLYSSGRPWLVMALFFIFSNRISKLNEKKLYLVAVGALLGEIFSFMINYYAQSVEHYKFYISYMILFVYLSFSFWRNSFKLTNTLIVLNLAILSGFRLNVLIVVLTIFQFIIFNFRNIKVRFKKFRYIIGLSAFSVIIFFIIKDLISPYTYARIFIRTRNFIFGGSDASLDTTKFDLIKNTFSLQDLSFIPSGFDMISKGRLSLYMDVPLIHFLNVFGLALGFFIILVILFMGLRFFVRRRISNSLEFSAWVFVIIFPFLLLLNGRFAYITYDAAIFGVIIGRWFACCQSKFK